VRPVLARPGAQGFLSRFFRVNPPRPQHPGAKIGLPGNDREEEDTHVTTTDTSAAIMVWTWRDGAACLDESPELFFPVGTTYPALLQADEATMVCRRCEVIDICLKWAIESGQEAGVWGGLTEEERHALKRRNARAHRARRVTE
jgi:WhiB family redox-sensing transcriptional regulator